MEEKPKKNKTETIKSIGLVIAGLVGIIVGAHFTVYSSVELAYTIGIPLSIVTILGIAIGTSLPELMVSISAIKTGDADLAIGNRSNAFNMLLVVGVSAFITDLYADQVVMGRC